jgi:type IV pilus assembly protein PilQ
MSSILRTNSLELIREEGSIYRVVPSSRVRRTPQREEITVHIPLNWVSAQAVRTILQPITDGDITADTLGNSLIISDTPVKVNEIVNIVRKIDKPEKQVMLEARLVEMDINTARELSIQWQMWRADNDGAPVADLVNGAFDTFGDPINLPAHNARAFNQFLTPNLGTGTPGIAGLDSFSVTGGSGIWTFGTEASIFGQDFQLDVLLRAFEQADLAKVLVNPRIATLNNQPASIVVQRQIPWQSTVVGLGGVTQPTWNYEPVGVTMQITPSITNNDYVRMIIRIQQDIFIRQIAAARPQVDTRQSQTNIIVRDEDTAAIMGLREQDFTDTELGVPWLRHIPVLGWIFKDKNFTLRKTDLLAFITPHIMKEEMILTDEEKFRYNEIDLQWDLPDYFYDDVKIDLSK